MSVRRAQAAVENERQVILREMEEVEKQHTLAVEGFKGPDPLAEACKEYPQLAKITNRDLLLDALESNAELRKPICEQH